MEMFTLEQLDEFGKFASSFPFAADSLQYTESNGYDSEHGEYEIYTLQFSPILINDTMQIQGSITLEQNFGINSNAALYHTSIVVRLYEPDSLEPHEIFIKDSKSNLIPEEDGFKSISESMDNLLINYQEHFKKITIRFQKDADLAHQFATICQELAAL